MRRLVLRIMINAGLAAVLLAFIGVMLAEVTGGLLTPSKPGLQNAPEMQGVSPEELRARLPGMMALGGAVFVTLGELLLYLIRGHPKDRVKTPAPPPDDAEKLLEELLRKVEENEKAKASETPPS